MQIINACKYITEVIINRACLNMFVYVCYAVVSLCYKIEYHKHHILYALFSTYIQALMTLKGLFLVL